MISDRQQLVLGNKGKELSTKKVCIVGMGALGCVSASLLARAGVKNFVLIDRDIVEGSNLYRQPLYTKEDINIPKVIAAKKALEKINPKGNYEIFYEDLNEKTISHIKADLILDGTDNLETRFLINEYAKKNKIPWIYAASIKEEGFLFNITPKSACLQCILKDQKTSETCDTVGVLNTITQGIATLQANEALKILTSKPHEQDLLYFNGKINTFKKIKVEQQKECPTCNHNFEYLNGKKDANTIKLCGTNRYKITGDFDFKKTKQQLKKLGIKDFKTAFEYKEMTVFEGVVIIKASSEKQAKSLYARYIGI